MPSARSKRTRPLFYSVALYLVGLILLVQVGMISVAIVLRANNVHILVEAPRLKRKEQLQIAATTPEERVRPTENGRGRLTIPEPDESPAPDVPPEPAPPIRKVDDVLALVQEAKRLRFGGNLDLALRSLLNAEEIDPKRTVVHWELATLHIELNNLDKAANYLQRLVDAGEESAGGFYSEAVQELAALDARSKASKTRQLSPNTSLGVTRKRRVEKDTNSFDLYVTIQRGPAAKFIDATKVEVQWYFYDKMPDGAIEPAIETPAVFFEDPETDWSDEGGKQEVIIAQYRLPDAVAKRTQREYYGYLMRIYYDGKLQFEDSEPSNLLNYYEPSS